MKTTTTAIVALVALLGTACEGLPVREINQTLEGAYDVETRYDMETVSGMFSGFAGQWGRPNEAIHSEILSTVEANYGAQIASGFESIYGQKLQQDINSYLNEEAPPWVMNLENRLGDVDKQLGTVDMQTSWLMVEKDAGEYEATQIWNGFAVFEDPDCPGSDALLCNQIEVTSQELLDAEYPVEVLSSDYKALDNGETMSLESHSLDFSYGRLGLYLLTNLILPDNPTEGVGLRDVVLGAINCRGLAGRVTGDDGTLGVMVAGVNVGLSLNDIIGNCEDSVFGVTTRFVDRFNAPINMNLQGGGQIIDTNRDGKIDQLTSGEVDGDMALTTFAGQTEEGPVDGNFTGFRVGDVD